MNKLLLMMGILATLSACQAGDPDDQVLYLQGRANVHTNPGSYDAEIDEVTPAKVTPVRTAEVEPIPEMSVPYEEYETQAQVVLEQLPEKEFYENNERAPAPRYRDDDGLPIEAYYPAEEMDQQEYLEAMEDNINPEVYAMVAKRTLNKMLDETAPLYEKAEAPTIYIRDVKIADARLPDGFFFANRITRKLMENANTFRVVNNKYEADYFLETEVDTVEFRNSQTPVIVYRVLLLDQRNGVIKEWKENIRQVKNDDRSWW